MCGRYYINPEDGGWLRELLATVERRHRGSESLSRMRLGEVFPGQIAPVIAQDGPQLMKWGYAGYGNRVINARSETAWQKPMFRKSFMEKRCLIPASGYYEWQRSNSGAKTREKYAFYRPDQPLLMAGLWRQEQGEDLPVFVILTREAGPEIAAIHDRMPVILPDYTVRPWLSGPDPALVMTHALSTVACQPAPSS